MTRFRCKPFPLIPTNLSARWNSDVPIGQLPPHAPRGWFFCWLCFLFSFFFFCSFLSTSSPRSSWVVFLLVLLSFFFFFFFFVLSSFKFQLGPHGLFPVP